MRGSTAGTFRTISIYRFAIVCALFLSLGAGRAADQPPSPVLQAMHAELERSMQKLKTQPVPPYFLSYEITETHASTSRQRSASSPAVSENRRRQLDIDMRVGDFMMDNTREIRGGMPANPYAGYTNITVPIENDPDAIRAVLWYHTDERYKRALEQFTKVKTNVQVKVAQEDQSTDFSREAAQQFSQPAIDIKVDRRVWEDKVRRYTAPFAQYTRIYDASATLMASAETRWYVNTEGTRIQVSQPAWRLFVTAYTKADDGMELPLYESFFGFSETDLPNDAAVLQAVHGMIHNLEALRVAPLTDPYTGPAILSGRASGVFFHEIFGHRVEGQRQKQANDAQTFKKKVNEQVLSKDFSVYFDPTARRIADTDLAGFYLYDNQGVKARRVDVVQNGVLKTFLMSRTPIEGFLQSNGHGRKQVGLNPVARQSNLIVDVAPSAAQADLKRLLIAEVKKQGLPFGLYFEDIQGGFTFTGRTIPNAFNVLPLVVYRIYPDGREELVRGVDLIGTPLTTFSKIAAADRKRRRIQRYLWRGIGRCPGVGCLARHPHFADRSAEETASRKSGLPFFPPPSSTNETHGSNRTGEKCDFPFRRCCSVVLAGAAPLPAQDDVVTKAMRDELDRSMKQLQLENLEKPYFISFRVVDSNSTNVSASFGALDEQLRRPFALVHRGSTGRRLQAGQYEFHFHELQPSAMVQVFNGTTQLPLDDDYKELRRQIWLATDATYKKAVEDLSKKRAALQNKSSSDEIPDFTKENPASNTVDAATVQVDRAKWETLARNLSALFRQMPDVYTSNINLSATNSFIRYLNSEGASYTRGLPRVTFSAHAATQAPDGTSLDDSVWIYARSLAELPSADELASRVRTLGKRLKDLRSASTIENYNGPVLVEGDAAAQLMEREFVPNLLAWRRRWLTAQCLVRNKLPRRRTRLSIRLAPACFPSSSTFRITRRLRNTIRSRWLARAKWMKTVSLLVRQRWLRRASSRRSWSRAIPSVVSSTAPEADMAARPPLPTSSLPQKTVLARQSSTRSFSIW